MSISTAAPSVSAEVAAMIEERVPWLDEEMAAALASASAGLPLYDWARYHLGWLDSDLRQLSPEERRKHGGKRLRGVLCILAGEAVGGEGRAVAPGGAAIEFIHNFSLVHDDVEDNDAERRHRPTVWKLWGVPQAINVGSNMQTMVNVAALRLGAHHPPERVVAGLETITRAIVRMTEGQCLDMSFEHREEVSLDDYFRMTGGKTAALIKAALGIGALLGGGSAEQQDALSTFGWEFGLAFQCRDDYLGIWGLPERTGKPVGSDILSGKRSLPIVYALEQSPAAGRSGQRLRSALQERDVPRVLECLEAVDAPAFVFECVNRYTVACLAGLERAKVQNRYGDAIRAIAEYALARDS